MSFFTPEELACRCNRSECDAEPIRPAFLGKLNLLRAIWGQPLIVNSGRRCRYWNEKVGGSPGSQHCLGNAVDIRVKSRAEADQLAELAEKVGLLGIGIYSTWVHVDDGPKRKWAG